MGDDPSMCGGSGMLNCLCLIYMGGSLLVTAGIWGLAFQIMYLVWWRPSCSPTGPVPETWPEEAVFPWWFNHNTVFHVCYVVFVILIAASAETSSDTPEEKPEEKPKPEEKLSRAELAV